MDKFFTFLFLSSLFLTSLNAEIVKDVKINGNKRVSSETIKIYGDIELNKDYSSRDLDLILKNLYETNFFENVDVSLDNSILTINLKEYPIINQLIILGEGNKRYKDQIRKTIQLKEKRSFIKSYLVKDIERIKSLYSSIGFNNASVETKIKKIDENNFDVLIEVNRGEKTKISSISFIGNSNVRNKRLKEVVASEEDKFWKVITKNTNLNENLIKLDLRLLKNYYRSLGFYDAEVSSNLAELNQTGNVDLIYSIKEGKRYTINKISTNVDPVFDKNLFFALNESYQKIIGEYYSPFTVKRLLEEIDELIEFNNLQFVEHNVEETIEGNSINIVFNIFEGKKTLIERINIKGNSITNEDVIRGELILDEGDPFTKLNLEKSISKIKSRNIFKNVNYKILQGTKKDLNIIEIEVEEKPTGEISAGAGIGTNGGSFLINVTENNYLGEGKSVGFDLELDAETLSGTLNYTDPNYDFLGNSINYFVSSEKNDKSDQGYENTVTSAGIGTGFEQYKDLFASLGISASYDDLTTDDTATESLKKQKGTFSDLSGNYGFKYDKRNRAFMPTRGSILSFGQSFPIIADKSSITNTLALSSYKSFNEDVVGAGKIFLTSVNGLGSDDVRLSKRVGLSSRRLRGFERGKVGPMDGNDHVGGNYAAAVNLETNLPNLLPEDTNTDVHLFLDFGNVWGVDYDSSLEDSNKIRSSTGVTASWQSPIGPLSFTLSQNLSKADTDVTQDFSFNLGTTF